MRFDVEGFKKKLFEIFDMNGFGAMLNDERADKFVTLTEILLEENEKYNLTAIKDPDKIILNHYADCAALCAELPEGARIADVGCGAGFPTLPVAILRPDLKITAIDSTAKRINYVSETARMLGLDNVTAIAMRAEDGGLSPEHREKYENIDVPPHVTSERELDFMTAFSYAARMLTAATIPTVYKDIGTVSAVFGENAKYLPSSALKNGVILDARAAEILTERGVDVGLKAKGERLNIVNEKFTHDAENVSVTDAFAYDLKLCEGAEIESIFTTFDTAGLTLPYPIYRVASFDDRRDIVGSYTYENSDGERFLVFSFDGQGADEALIRSYARADQLKRIIPRLGKSCGFTVCTSPSLYTVAKRDGDKTAIGLWNLALDSVENPFIRLDNGIRARITSTIGCTAELRVGVIELSRIEPQGFAAVEYEVSYS